MALSFPKLFQPKQVNNAAVDTIYTVPATPNSNTLRNARLRFANTTAGAVTIKAWAVPSAGASADSNVMLPTKSINANDFIDVDVPTMVAGDIIQAQSGAAASITVHAIDGFLQS